MKKFTKLNENKTVETSTNKKDFISSLIDETLSVENGEIIGKDVLSKTLNRILELNDSKTVIKVLESIKVRSFHTLNFEWINEAIETEKKKMYNNEYDEECVDCGDEEECEGEDCGDEECDDVSEALNEGKQEIKIEVEVKPCDEEDCDEEDEKEESELIIDEFEEPSEEVKEEEDMFMKEGYNFLSDIHELSKIMESIKDSVNEEHHLETKEDRIEYILSRISNKGVEKVVLDVISELPEYVKTADIEETLKNLSDKEVEELYFNVEMVK